MRVIVTRVQPQAARWVKLLMPRFEAVALPLIETRALADTSALQAAGQRWADYRAVMFVSSHAVDYFFAASTAIASADRAPGALNTRAWATGPATRAALLAQGLPDHLVDAPPVQAGQFDSESLWQEVQSQVTPGTRVLIVRGDSRGAGDVEYAEPGADGALGVGRDWLAQRLRQAGAGVDFVVAYQRGAPLWTNEQRTLATGAADDGSVWLFSSAEALTHLQSLLPDQDWSRSRAVATHARIAQAARSLGFAVVVESRPTLTDSVASIESLS